MRIRISLVVSAVVLFVSILASAQPIAAAPAEHVAVDACYAYPGSPWSSCYQERGVIKSNTSASGNTMRIVHVERCVQQYYNGEQVSDYCSKQHYNLHQKEGELHVWSTRSTQEHTFVYKGVTYTCTSSYHVVFANGEYRHNDYQSSCTPPR